MSKSPLVLALFGLLSLPLCAAIDREALVRRHDPRLQAVAPGTPFSVGNGGFVFNADVTGLQTFQELYSAQGMPLETLARWAWHTDANPQNFTLADASTTIDTHGVPVQYPNREKTPAGQWLRSNPHDMPLGQLGFCDAEGRPLRPEEVVKIDQSLDLWAGVLHSRFEWRGFPVEVDTLVSQSHNELVVRVRSEALGQGLLRLSLVYPRGHDPRVKNTPPLDFSEPASHSTRLREAGSGRWLFERARDDFHYEARLSSTPALKVTKLEGAHRYGLQAAENARELVLCLSFARPGGRDWAKAASSGPDWSRAQSACASAWENFWRSGAAVDFSGSSDPRASELERRVVLSQYLTQIQIGGLMPPQETGLTCSSWYGKHHTEMVWWHVAHFAQWGRIGKVEQTLAWFDSVLPRARQTAKERGLAGARWSKMVGPDGRESPGGTSLIYWNQPHPIYLAELVYREKHDKATLERWKAVVFESAECLASMLHYEASQDRYVLGPPMWIAQELYDQRKSQNPTYELAYWAWALEVAQTWRERLGLPREKSWDERVAKLSKLPVRDGKYVSIESIPDTWENPETRHDHPSFLMPYGQFQWRGVDPQVMRETLRAVMAQWRWEVKIWGWDYPMISMTAARVGDLDTAVDFLLKDGPNNRYQVNGHCPQRKDLGVYLPANGAMLSAVALMVGGWDAAPATPAPGFPRNGKWKIEAEGFRKLP